MHVQPTNVTGWQDLFVYANTVTDNMFGLVIIIVTFTITFMALKGYPSNRAFAASSFLTALMAIFFKYIGIVNDLVVFIAIICVGFSIIGLITEER